jgi:hypothetical protein
VVSLEDPLDLQELGDELKEPSSTCQSILCALLDAPAVTGTLDQPATVRRDLPVKGVCPPISQEKP